MTLESQVASLTTATTKLLDAVNVKKTTLDASVATATTKADVATTKAGEASGSAASALAIYGNTAAMNTAVSTSTTNAATATTQAGIATTQATAAAASAASAAAIVTGVASNRPSVRPTLLIDFAAMGKLDPRITFGRASTALAYDGKTTVKAEENLATYSQVFTNAAWSKASVTATDNVTTAPDGTTTAASIVPSASTNVFALYQQVSVSGSEQTHSVFAKAFGYSKIQLREANSGGKYASFDLVNGVVINSVNSTASITPLANGWYRCAMTIAYSGAARNGIYVLPTSYTSGEIPSFTADGTSGVYLWGGQIETNPYATAYTPTTTAAITNYIPALQSYAANVARFDFNPVTGESLGLMVEEQRANLLTYSQNFNDPSWTKTYGAVLDNCVIAPDGTFTASKLYETTQSIGIKYHSVYKAGATSVTGTYTLSVYAKAGERSFVWLSPMGSGANSGVFNLSNGTVTTNGTTTNTITPVGNGWYRCTSTSTISAASAYGYVGVASNATTIDYLGDGYSGVYIWGAQLEAGAFATSYIPTLLTYSGRGSTGTFIGDNGLIQTAAANVARYQRNIAGAVQLLLEGAGSNLLNWSSDLSQWGLSATSVYVIKNCAVAPDGTYTADLLAAPSTSGSFAAYQTFVAGVTSGSNYTFSIYAKAAVVSKMSIRSISNTADAGRIIDLSNGTVGANITNTDFVSCTVTPAQNGWYRIALTVVARTTTANVYIYCEDVNSAAVNGGVYFWGAQLEVGTVPTSYIPSSDSFTSRSGSASYFDPSGVMRYAPAGLARYDFDPVTGLSKGLLLEGAGQNLISYASDFTNGNWSKTRSTVVAASTTAPDGTLTGTKLVEDTTTSNTHDVRMSYLMSNSGTNTYAMSIFVKKAERFWVYLELEDGSNTSNRARAWFDVNNGVVGTGNTAGSGITYVNHYMTSVGNGWYRLTLVGTAAGTVTALQFFASLSNGDAVSYYTGDGASGVYIWGSQLELGYVSTSFIPTAGSQVTRAADVGASVANSRAADVWSSAQATRLADLISALTGTNFSSWFNNQEGTLYAEYSLIGINPASPGYNQGILSINDGNGYGNSISLLNSTSTGTFPAGSAYVGAVNQASQVSGSSAVVGTKYRLAISFKTGAISTYLSGSQLGSTATGRIPNGMTQMQIACDYNGATRALNGYIKRIGFYPKAIPTSELAGLTS